MAKTISSNHSILTQNTLLGLSEPAQLLYLDLLDKFEGHTSKKGELKAFRHACRMDKYCGSTFERIISNYGDVTGMSINEETRQALYKFFADRWKNSEKYMADPFQEFVDYVGIIERKIKCTQ